MSLADVDRLSFSIGLFLFRQSSWVGILGRCRSVGYLVILHCAELITCDRYMYVTGRGGGAAKFLGKMNEFLLLLVPELVIKTFHFGSLCRKIPCLVRIDGKIPCVAFSGLNGSFLRSTGSKRWIVEPLFWAPPKCIFGPSGSNPSSRFQRSA